ncbi:MAG: HK97 family phage prohead protease [Chloroflexi bacterium]|nr:HK97 family phage prohead protease [Chloroflexota bacterium]
MDFEKLSERVEARSVAFTDLETTSDGATFTGYAAVYDQEADLGDFTESINRGAFRKALSQGQNVPMLLDHNPMLPPVATTGGGTLRLSEDTKGLKVEADIANHFMGDALREMVKRGDIRGMSFGFIAGKGNSRVEERGGKPHRVLTGFNVLLDVSPTWNPAYPGTDAAFRSLTTPRMAESIEAEQQDGEGSHQQLPDGAPISTADAGVVDEVKDPPVPAEVQEPEQRSGAEVVELAAAARRRRLQLLGVALPRV